MRLHRVRSEPRLSSRDRVLTTFERCCLGGATGRGVDIWCSAAAQAMRLIRAPLPGSVSPLCLHAADEFLIRRGDADIALDQNRRRQLSRLSGGTRVRSRPDSAPAQEAAPSALRFGTATTI